MMMMMMMISAPPYYVSARITTAETRMRLALDCREQRRNAFDKKIEHIRRCSPVSMTVKMRQCESFMPSPLLKLLCRHAYTPRTHSFKLSSQHDERNFIDRMLFKNANPVCTQ